MRTKFSSEVEKVADGYRAKIEVEQRHEERTDDSYYRYEAFRVTTRTFEDEDAAKAWEQRVLAEKKDELGP